jgi:hypothetical protein
MFCQGKIRNLPMVIAGASIAINSMPIRYQYVDASTLITLEYN